MLKKIMDFIFGWETVYFTSNLQEYASVRGRLIEHGIKTKTKTDGNSLNGRGHSGTSFGSNFGRNYEILVRKEDADKANEAIHSHR